MQIGKNTVVSVSYTLSDTLGNEIEKSQEPMTYLHGGYDNTLPKIEEALEGKEVGYVAHLQLDPVDAFGDYDTELLKIEPVDRLPEPLELGMQFEGETDEDHEPVIYTVTEIADGKVVLDGNHPLAGIAVRFEITVDQVREATEEEIAHGHVHGAHGHDHDHGHADEVEPGDQFTTYHL